MKNIIGKIKCLFGRHDFDFKDSRLEYDYNKRGYYHRIIKECKQCERQRHEFMFSKCQIKNFCLLAVIASF